MSKRKNPSGADNPNADFCDFLMELADYEKNVSRNVHKYNAYRKAASTLAAHGTRVSSGDDARKLSGIGDKISKKIDEFLATGKLRKLENIRGDEDVTAIALLTRVSGVGPVKAAELVRAGVRSLADLERQRGQLTHHQLIGLKYFEDFEKKIPRSEIQEIEDTLKTEICKLDSEYTVTICGSYRRGKTESGDIDVLLTHPTVSSSDAKGKHREHLLRAVVSALEACGLVTDTISLGDTKFMGVCRAGSGGGAGREGGVEERTARRLDIRLAPHDQYHCCVLYFTGSDVFNKTMRAHALERGFTLNEYSLRPVGATGVPGEPVPITSEEDIFDYIDYPYKTPEQRNM